MESVQLHEYGLSRVFISVWLAKLSPKMMLMTILFQRPKAWNGYLILQWIQVQAAVSDDLLIFLSPKWSLRRDRAADRNSLVRLQVLKA